MVNWSKLYAFLRFFPEVVWRPDQLTHNRQKVIYTTILLFIFLTVNQLPLYGIPVHQGTATPDPLYWEHPFFASNGLLALGIGPIILSEIITQILVASRVINVDINAPDPRTLLAQKLMGILFTIMGAIARLLGLYSSGKVSTGNAVLVLVQILFSGIIIYLDDILKKGYGLLSSVSLFTATTICGDILWKAFSLKMFIYPEQATEFEGVVPAWVHLLITRTDKFSAMREAFYRQNLPNVTNLLATCLFVLLAISFQGLTSIGLPVGTHGLLCMKYGGNKLLNLLATWNRPNHFKRSFLVGGILYYITTPPTLVDLHRAPFHAFIYEEQRVLAQPDSIPRNEFNSHVLKAARFGGFCVGALIILGDFIGVLGSGTGIMLAVTTLYPYFDGRSGEVGAFGF
ncbi:unnamed protein product [Urochloa decumbens]|uniref:Translocon Sec61/SecY plug domain-containing protein n=1 Tax=Urochloa decumbens TaxID=240449 RepID=A0ABC9A012_9POAL